MSLPKPNCSFTIPSIYDDTILDCRLYFPKRPTRNSGIRAAIIAHPYAPLGGCFDDLVVSSIGSVLLKTRHIVGTFNFRGAHGSNGRTSWAGKAELADYVSFYGFMLYFMSQMQLSDVSTSDLSSTDIRLVLCGYSYGSMIVSCLPGLQVVQNLFNSPLSGSAQAEIWLRAKHLSEDQAQSLAKAKVQSDTSHEKSIHTGTEDSNASSSLSPIAMGGYESDLTHKRISHDSSRMSLDFESVRQGVDRLRDKFRHGAPGSALPNSNCDKSSQPVHLPTPEIGYLVISPLLPPLASFITMFSRPSLTLKGSAVPGSEGDEEELIRRPTCAVFGTKDSFTSHKRLRKWAEDLRRKSTSAFTFYEIEGAGHFWHEHGVELQLRKSIEEWLGTL